MTDSETLRRHCTEVWGLGDIDLARSIYAPDIVDLNPWPGQRPGADGMIDVVKIFHSGMSEVVVDIHEIVPLGDDRWLDRWTMRGRHSGSIMGFKPSNRLLEFSGVDIVTFHNGLMTSQWHVEETLQLLMQAGLRLPE